MGHPLANRLNKKSNKMAKEYFLPRTDSKKKDFQHNLGDKLTTYQAKYGISALEVTDTQNGDAYFTYWLDVLGEVDSYKQKVTQFKNEVRDGVAAGATASIEPVAPTFGPPPTAVAPGIFVRSASLGSRIKKHKDYVNSDGVDMQLEGVEKPGPDTINGKPTLTIVLKAGQPLLQWAKNNFDGLWIETDRDGAGWKFLALDTEPDYLDTAALPATAANWKYRAIYTFHDEKVGMWSDEVSVNVKA
jgi:hypothetical protein